MILTSGWMNTKILCFISYLDSPKKTFYKLLAGFVSEDTSELISKKYRGGHFPVTPEKSLLVFLWFMEHQDTYHSIGERFQLARSTVFRIINVFLYLTLKLKKKYVFWPQTQEEFEHLKNGFPRYPGTIGAIDAAHIKVIVSPDQQDSYLDRNHNHSINLMAVCTSTKFFTYIFVGFPGCAHDARVFSYSGLCSHIDRYGMNKLLPNNSHIIGDSAFPLRVWLMTPYRGDNLTRIQKHHNYCLSSSRICIENAFSWLRSRWQKIQLIYTYTLSKAVEISTAACVLLNFCILNNDLFEETSLVEELDNENFLRDNNQEALRAGEQKRNIIAADLFANYH